MGKTYNIAACSNASAITAESILFPNRFVSLFGVFNVLTGYNVGCKCNLPTFTAEKRQETTFKRVDR